MSKSYSANDFFPPGLGITGIFVGAGFGFGFVIFLVDASPKLWPASAAVSV